MPTDSQFLDLIARVRAGEEWAARQLVEVYEPAIRRAVRIRLVDARLRRVFDSMDISQSVFGSFFCRAALGEFELANPDDLVRLLVVMARNKLASHVRHELADRRDVRRLDAAPVDPHRIEDRTPTPSRLLEAKELVAELRKRLSGEERELADARASGLAWNDIARARGQSAELLRKRLARGIERAAAELDIEV
jgi:RNA polymerase sigma-70 factor (ECF subfamily)